MEDLEEHLRQRHPSSLTEGNLASFIDDLKYFRGSMVPLLMDSQE